MQIQLDEISLDEFDGEGATYKASETRNSAKIDAYIHELVFTVEIAFSRLLGFNVNVAQLIMPKNSMVSAVLGRQSMNWPWSFTF